MQHSDQESSRLSTLPAGFTATADVILGPVWARAPDTSRCRAAGLHWPGPGASGPITAQYSESAPIRAQLTLSPGEESDFI